MKKKLIIVVIVIVLGIVAGIALCNAFYGAL